MDANFDASLPTTIRFESVQQNDVASFVEPDDGAAIRPTVEGRTAGKVVAVDAIKAISSQLIVLHHFCLYGPMTDAAWGFAPRMFKWFANDARLAVQCFLVVAGFLAAGALLPGGAKPWLPPSISSLPEILFGRYRRLSKVYFVGLFAAIACAAIARTLVDDPSTPAAPGWTSLLAHLLFVQDLLGIPALTAGAWYVAIDLQLYATLALICAASALWTSNASSAKTVAMAITVALGLCSLMVFNRHNELEIWGIYFFGSYSLGVAARWASQAKDARKWLWLAAMMLTCALALCVQWRSRIAISTLTALVLVTLGSRSSTRSESFIAATSFLARISFPLFVLHYPALMLVGSLVKAGWGNDPLPSAIGLGVAWVLSMAAANALSSWLDSASRTRSTKTKAPDSILLTQ